jgi:Ca2+-binding RTX toxin-like protein
MPRRTVRRKSKSSASQAAFQNLETRSLLAGITFDAGTGVVTVDGSIGNDVALITTAGTQITFSLTGVSNQNFQAAAVNEIVFFGRDGSDTFTNNSAIRSRAFGQKGNDVLRGGSGNDLLNGGLGDDQAFGNGGNDVLIGDAGLDLLNGGIGGDWVDGSAGNDTLFGWDGVDTLVGGEGDDYGDGGSGNDRNYGGAGADTLVGGLGDDTLAGQLGDDRLMGRDGNDTLYGNEGRDNLLGEAGDDRLWAGSDADFVGGGSGSDVGGGNSGNDILVGDDGIDQLFGDDGNDDLYGGNQDDSLRGGTGLDRLFGQSGSDDLDGESGDDDLTGGPDSDRMRGGSDNDDYFSDSSDDLFDDSEDYLSGGDFEIRGTVSNLDTVARTFALLGLTVNYSAARVDGTLANGAFYKAEGTFAGGVLVAHHVEPKLPGDSQDNFEARGSISNLNTAAQTFTFLGLTVSYAGAEVHGTLSDGAMVKVEGQFNGSTVNAREVENGIGDDQNLDRNFEIRGNIENLDTTAKTFTVLGFTVNYSQSQVIGTPVNGAFFKVDGNYNGTLVTAREIEPEQDGGDENIELRGEVTNLDTSSQTFDLLGIRISYAGAEIVNPFSNGTVVEVEGFYASQLVTAERIR